MKRPVPVFNPPPLPLDIRLMNNGSVVLMVIFAGMVLAAANDLRRQLLALAVSVVVVLEYWGLTSAAFYVGGACTLVLFVRGFLVPAPVKILVAEIAAASLFIYLVHYQIMSVDLKLFGVIHPWGSLISAIVVGVVATHVYAWGLRKFRLLTTDIF